MRIPKNLIKEGLYTKGGEFINSKTNTIYQGYYSEFNGNYFIGKNYTPDSIQLNKNISKTKKISRLFSFKQEDLEKGYSMRYFMKKSSGPIIIKEIDEETYKNIQKDINFISVKLKFYTTNIGEGQDYKGGFFNEKELNEADKKMPGLKLFLQN